MGVPIEACGRTKIYGYFVGLALVGIKIAMVIVVCKFHIPLGYSPIQSIRLSCIATSVGFGISAIHTTVLMILKSISIQKLSNFHKPLWLNQYIVTSLCVMLFIRYINIDYNPFQWFKAIIIPIIMVMEFAFFKLFIEPKPKEKVIFITPTVKATLRRFSMKNPTAIDLSRLTK